LTGLYGTSATCASKSGQVYGSSYDAWGNVTSRSITNGTSLLTYTLAYDGLDHLVRWNDMQTTTNEEWYMYDASGQRVLRRSQTGTGTSNTKYTVYAFGVQDDVYDGSGASNNHKYYYSLAGHLIGELNGGSTKFLLTDLLGSVVASISNTVGSAAVLGNQVYGPYGNGSYSKGAITTPKGYTGQYNDGLTQLDYYNARYYDPFVGVFLSADTKQGNMQGVSPYAYVGGNPETMSDPTGYRPAPLPQGPPMSTSDILTICLAYESCAGKVRTYNTELLKQYVLDGLGWVVAGLELIPAGLEALFGNPEGLQMDEQEFEELSTGSVETQAIEDAGWGCSFTSATVVETLHGKQAIGKVQTGEKVLAYNPHTRKMEWQPIVHVWIHQDNDLVDLTITTPAQSPTRTSTHGSPQTREVVHTNKEHPFFTMEKGFLPVGQIKVGMHLIRADGRIGIVTAWILVPGVQTMYNLEVAQDHTFTVGSGEWVVHNCAAPNQFTSGINNLLSSSDAGAQQNAEIAKLAQDENFNITEFRVKVPRPDGSKAGDIDLGTPETIVESKVGDHLDQGDREQLPKLLGQGPDGQYVNPGGRRTLIYYAPDLNPEDVNRVESAGGYVAQNPQQLIALLEYFDPSWS
jgi:RHS repeat-associated protein